MSVIRSRPQSESKYQSFGSALRAVYEQAKKIETHYRDQIVVGSYTTSHFEMCPKAQKLYTNLPVDVNTSAAERTAHFLDQLFALEKSVIAVEKSTKDDIKKAEEYAEKAMEMARRADLEKEHSFVQDHVEKIKSYHTIEDNKKENVTDKDVKTRFARPSLSQTPEPKDMDIDNQQFRISRNIKAQRKLKIIDND